MAAAFASFAATAMATGIFAQTKVEPHWNMFTEDQDVEIGRQSAVEAEKKLVLIKDPRIVTYVESLGKALVAKSRGPNFPYTFKVVDSSEINAFALPGGAIYVNRGILESARNDGEVAGVLAHEISHVVLRHGTANVSKQQLAQAGFGLLGGLLGGRTSKTAGEVIQAAGGFGLNALFLKYSRTSETEADVNGVQILTRARYNPQDMIGFFETLEKADTHKTAEWMSSHPAPEHRIERISEEAKLLRVKPARTETFGLGAVQAALKTMPAAGSAGARVAKAPDVSHPPSTASPIPGGGTGTAAGGRLALPSQQVRAFADPQVPFRVSYPANWSAYHSGRTGVAFAPEGGTQLVDGTSQLIAGAIVNRYQPFGNDAVDDTTDEQAANMRVRAAFGDIRDQIFQMIPSLQKVQGSGKPFRVPDGTRKGLLFEGTDPRTGQAERVALVARQLPGGSIVYVILIAPQRQADAYQPALTSMVDSIRPR